MVDVGTVDMENVSYGYLDQGSTLHSTNSVLHVNNSMYDDEDYENVGFYFYENIENLRKPWVKEPHFLPLVIVYGTVFLLGITGNIVVIFSVLGSRANRSVTFSFMVSLALADVLFLLVVVPHETLRMVLGEWSGGRVFCKISGFTEMLTASASILNLTAVSFERYFVIVMPMASRRKCTLGNTRKLLVAVWIIAAMLSAPALYVKDIEITTYYNNASSVSMMFCADLGLGDNQRIHFAVYQFLSMFIIPTILMIFCYTVVIYVLWISGQTLVHLTSTNRCREFRSRDLNGTYRSESFDHQHRKFLSKASSNGDIRNSIIKGRKQVIKMLITVIMVFLLCWGPKLLFQVFKYSDIRTSMHTQVYFNLQIVIYCLPYIQSFLNPVIYGCMSKSFRMSFVTSCNNYMYRTPCYKRHVRTANIELESKYSNGTVHTKAIRNTPSPSA